MDERDLQQFQDYVREFERTVGDKRTSQGLANLVMIQKSLGDRALSPVKLDDDAVYTSGRNGGISRVSHMKVELDGASEDTFRPLIEGLRRSTINVRLKNSFYDIIEPLASELMVQQLNKMIHENELHREDVIYYRQIINAVDNLGKSNRNSFLESVLLGYRRFTRNPIWTSLNWTLKTLQSVVFRPLMGILTGFRRKSDTDRIVDAINKQTEFLRTGQVSRRGLLDQFRYGGIMGVIGGSISNAFSDLFKGEEVASPQKHQSSLLEKSNQLDKTRNKYLSDLIALSGHGNHFLYETRSLLVKEKEKQSSQSYMMQEAANDMVEEQKKVANGVSTLSTIEESFKSHRATFSTFHSMTLDQMKTQNEIGSYLGMIAESQDMTLEEQERARKELEEHNKREKRRTLLSFFKTIMPGVLGILGLGALAGGAWYLAPDKVKDVIGDAVYWGMSQIWNNMGLSSKLLTITGSLAAMAVVFKSLTIAKGALAVGIVTGWYEMVKGLTSWAREKSGDSEPMSWDDIRLESIRGDLLSDAQARRAFIEDRLEDAFDSGDIMEQRKLQQKLGELLQEENRIREMSNEQLRDRMDPETGSIGTIPQPGPITSSGLDFVRRHEGLRTEAYRDQAGIPTIGYGNTMINGRPVRMGDRITEEQAERMFQEDFMNRRSAVSNMVSVPLEPHQLDALTSLSYNIGLGALRGSTLLRNLNKGDFAGAQEQFGEWNKITDPETGQKVVSRGLTRRRQEEAAMFGWTGASQATPVPSNDTPTISREAISSAGQVTGAGGDTREEEVGLLASIASGMRRLIQIMQERGDSGGINLSDTGTSHAAYGD